MKVQESSMYRIRVCACIYENDQNIATSVFRHSSVQFDKIINYYIWSHFSINNLRSFDF